MSVWFKYPSDKDITPGHPSGSSIFAPGTVGGGPPAYGTVLSTGYGVDYETGANAYSNILANFVYLQSCDVDTKADGLGGSYVDWYNATNIQYKPVGTYIANSSEDFPDVPVEVPSGSGVYHNSGEWTERNEVHDGNGGINTVGTGTFSLYTVGTVIYTHSVNNTEEVPYGSAHREDNGKADNYEYQWNGTGGYNNVYIDTTGSYFANGTEVATGSLRYDSYSEQMADVPSTSGNLYPNGKTYEYTYCWDGSGGYYGDSTGNLIGSYASFHDFISYQDCPSVGIDGSTVGLGYYWDGNGGYIIDYWP
jgi:hypothetical protein